MNEFYEEDHLCPECHAGRLHYPPVKNCRCHTNPPCSACVDNKLTCPKCGWEWDAPEQIDVPVCPGILERIYPAKRKIHVFPHGGRIMDFDYDSSSGSTMDYKGKYEGDVSASDIIAALGDGTFGHRGPLMSNGKFSYAKITD